MNPPTVEQLVQPSEVEIVGVVWKRKRKLPGNPISSQSERPEHVKQEPVDIDCESFRYMQEHVSSEDPSTGLQRTRQNSNTCRECAKPQTNHSTECPKKDFLILSDSIRCSNLDSTMNENEKGNQDRCWVDGTRQVMSGFNETDLKDTDDCINELEATEKYDSDGTNMSSSSNESLPSVQTNEAGNSTSLRVKEESMMSSNQFPIKTEQGEPRPSIKQETTFEKGFRVKKSLSDSDSPEEDSDDFINESEDEISTHLRFEASRPEPTDNRRYKKLKHRKIQSIDQAVIPSNYQHVPAIVPEEIVEVIVDKGKKSERLIKWTTQRPNPSTLAAQFTEEVRTRRGVNPSYRYADTMFKAWRLFFNDDLLDHIVKCTNVNMKRQSRTAGGPFRNYNHAINRTELIAYFGLLYARGIFNWNTKPANLLWTEEHGRPMFRATMPYNRFRYIGSSLCFDDTTTREERWVQDRFTAFRHCFEKFFDNCAAVMAPDDYLTLDETLYPTRGVISFKQYNKNKPAKYGILFRSICSARVSYTYASSAFAGIPVGGERDRNPEFYPSSTKELAKNLVEKMEKHNTLAGCCITYDRYYTSLELACIMLQKNIFTIGVIHHNKKGVGAVAETKDRQHLSTKFYTHTENKHIKLASYVVRKKGGKQNVLVLSTHPKTIYGITEDDRKRKPAIVKLYDFTKGGVDIMDHRINNFTTKQKTRKWTRCALAYILDTARVNAQTVMLLNNGKGPRRGGNSFELCYGMAKEMALPLIKKRGENTSCLRRSLKEAISAILNPPKKNAPMPFHIFQRKKEAYHSLITQYMLKGGKNGPASYLSMPPRRNVRAAVVAPASNKDTKCGKPKKYNVRKNCRACIRECDGKVPRNFLPRGCYMCEICEEPLCRALHGYFRCPPCNQRDL